ncbi:transcription initiation factor TFIIIB [Lysinibacillus sp. KU-BSD001]|uniref:transcription initiation factor TFIIIB n=1 Tax=Lysinibacillus sp. KU-BSD001 TaxID=3141328 RepID=UPI0036EFE589
MRNEAKECPKCGCTHIGYGKQGGYGNVSANGKLSFGSAIMHVICTDCGYVIESYATRPKSFKGTLRS